jgi:hypothetical protein
MESYGGMEAQIHMHFKRRHCKFDELLWGLNSPATHRTSKTLFTDVTPCSSVQVFRRFGSTYWLHHRQRVNTASRGLLLPASFWFLGLTFESEDGGSKFLRNFGTLLDYASIHRGRQFPFFVDQNSSFGNQICCHMDRQNFAVRATRVHATYRRCYWTRTDRSPPVTLSQCKPVSLSS